jgi:hypothetical protein
MRVLTYFAVVVIFWFLPCAIVAQEAVTFSYYMVKASKSDSGEMEIDDSLKGLASVLKGTGYTKFQALGTRSVSTQVGQSTSVTLTGDYSMVLTPQQDGDTCKLSVQIIQKTGESKTTILDVTIPLKKGKPFVVVGPAIEGGTLVLVFVGQ